MKIVAENDDIGSTALTGRSYTRLEIIYQRFVNWLWCLHRDYIPHLVWHGQDVDVQITFSDIRLAPDCIMENLRYEGDMETLWRAEGALHQLGLTFDAGTGCGGRDWEFDWSLCGPVKVSFRRKHKGDRKPKEQRPPLLLITDSKGD